MLAEMEHPIQGLMRTAMESIKGMVDVNTVVGDPVETQDGTLIIPVSRVAFGFAAGGGEYGMAPDRTNPEGEGFPFGGGSGAGVSVQPMGFLVVGQNQVRVLSVDGAQPIERIIDMAPQLIDRLRGRTETARTATAATGPDTGVPRTTIN